MASERGKQRASSQYSSYGNVAYAYDGGAVRAPGREDLPGIPQPKVRTRTKQRTLTRVNVRVREAGYVSPFAVVGFLAVGVFACLLLFSHAQYTSITAEVVSLRSQMSTLQTENATLAAQYEQVFDMTRIQAAVGDTMVRLTSEQIEYIDLSEPDSVVLYKEFETEDGLDGFIDSVQELGEDLFEYFR